MTSHRRHERLVIGDGPALQVGHLVHRQLGLAAPEYQAWVSGFEFLQTLRLRIQLEGTAPPRQPNHLEVAQLNDIDRRILRESFRVARSLQQRLQLDYER